MKTHKPDAATMKEIKAALPVAIAAALEAGALVQKKFGKHRSTSEKPDTSLVTEVDKASEKIVIRHLRGKFPLHHIFAEETGLSEGQKISSFKWHIDPIDGTTNFVHAFPMCCVSIGLEHEEFGPVLGVIYHPAMKALYHAVLGQGAFANKSRMKVSKTKHLSSALLSTGFSMKKTKYLDSEMATFRRVVEASLSVRRTGSAALDLTFVATGQFDGFWERGLNSWDVCAAIALINEAGGLVTRMDGKPYRLGDDSILATNGPLHRELRQVMR